MPPRRRGRPRRVDAPRGAEQDQRSVVPPPEPEGGQRVESVHEGGDEPAGGEPVVQPADVPAADRQQLLHTLTTLVHLLTRQEPPIAPVPEPPQPVVPSEAHQIPGFIAVPAPSLHQAGPSIPFQPPPPASVQTS